MPNFYSKMSSTKSKLQTSIEWHTLLSSSLENQISKTHVDAFLDVYSNYSEIDLGLKIGVTKKDWLTNMIKEELDEVKKGNRYLVTISLQDSIAGFIICEPAKVRHENLKIDIHLSLLAVKPFRDFKTKNKIRIGLGHQLVDSVESRFSDFNTITLDTRLVNTPAQLFYEKIGFASTGKRTFGGCDPKFYMGYEKRI